MFWLHCLLLSLLSGEITACYGGGGVEVTLPKNGTKLPINNTEALWKLGGLIIQKGGSNPAYGGFSIPESVASEWRAWLEQYKMNQKQLANDTEGYYGEGGPGAGIPGWPQQWIGMSQGEQGFPPNTPPPWGYKAKNLGLALVCYLNADRGQCPGNDTSPVMRWGFHAHIQECVEFEYSGCEGNQNNFLTELACYDKCSKPVPGGCDMDTDIAVSGQGLFDDLHIGSRRCGYIVKENSPTGE